MKRINNKQFRGLVLRIVEETVPVAEMREYERRCFRPKNLDRAITKERNWLPKDRVNDARHVAIVVAELVKSAIEYWKTQDETK